MTKPKGGRGNKAPYESTHVRVPVPLKEEIEQRIEEYREFVTSGTQPEVKKFPSLEESLDFARKVHKAKKSKVESLAKLLTSIYGVEISESDITC